MKLKKRQNLILRKGSKLDAACVLCVAPRTLSLPAPPHASLGSTTVRYDVTDSSGNAAFCTFTVTIADMEKPSLACPATQGPACLNRPPTPTGPREKGGGVSPMQPAGGMERGLAWMLQTSPPSVFSCPRYYVAPPLRFGHFQPTAITWPGGTEGNGCDQSGSTR